MFFQTAGLLLSRGSWQAKCAHSAFYVRLARPRPPIAAARTLLGQPAQRVCRRLQPFVALQPRSAPASRRLRPSDRRGAHELGRRDPLEGGTLAPEAMARTLRELNFGGRGRAPLSMAIASACAGDVDRTFCQRKWQQAVPRRNGISESSTAYLRLRWRLPQRELGRRGRARHCDAGCHVRDRDIPPHVQLHRRRRRRIVEIDHGTREVFEPSRNGAQRMVGTSQSMVACNPSASGLIRTVLPL